MKRNPEVTMAICASVAFLTIHSLWGACGMNWRIPHVGPFEDGHFDEKGHVLYGQEIGRLKLGERASYEEIPLYIKFSSKYQIASPYLGHGWKFPLLDSRIVQLNEREFLAEMPNGWTRIFHRKDASATLLQEGGGWMGEIKDDIISVYAECGWKLVFKKGHLISMSTPKGHRLDYRRHNGMVQEIKLRNSAILKVEASGRDKRDEVIRINFDGEDFVIEHGDMPQVQSIAGDVVVGSVQRSLCKLELPNGTEYSYRFALDQKLNPTLEIVGPEESPRVIKWDGRNNQILVENDWTYSISSPAPGASTNIQREDSLGRKESWSYDNIRGRTAILNRYGVSEEREWFTSGILRGRIREKRVFRDGIEISRIKYIYDGNGTLLARNINGDRIWNAAE